MIGTCPNLNTKLAAAFSLVFVFCDSTTDRPSFPAPFLKPEVLWKVFDLNDACGLLAA